MNPAPPPTRTVFKESYFVPIARIAADMNDLAAPDHRIRGRLDQFDDAQAEAAVGVRRLSIADALGEVLALYA